MFITLNAVTIKENDISELTGKDVEIIYKPYLVKPDCICGLYTLHNNHTEINVMGELVDVKESVEEILSLINKSKLITWIPQLN